MDRWGCFLAFIQVSGSMVCNRAYLDEGKGAVQASNEDLNSAFAVDFSVCLELLVRVRI